MKIKNKKGFTLLELSIGAAILVVALTGIMAMFSSLLSFNEDARKLSLAIISCQNKMEEIRNSDFDTIDTNFGSTTFIPAGFAANESMGSVTIYNANPELLTCIVTVSWRGHSNRLIGEDLNLNGILDFGEDSNLNGILDSPATIVTYIGRR